MVGGMGVDFGQSLGVSPRLGGVIGWSISVALLGLSLGLEDGGRQMLGLNSRGLSSPKHGGVR
jgi:hypothetical protein